MADKKLSNEEKLQRLLEKGIEILANHLKNQVPERGSFEKYFCTFDIPGTENSCRIFIEPWLPGGAESRTFHIGALRKSTDMLVSYYVKKGTNAELLEYLAQADTVKEWYDFVRDLSRSVDEKW